MLTQASQLSCEVAGRVVSFARVFPVASLDDPAQRSRDAGVQGADRLGLVVYPNGSSHVMLIDNETRAVAKLYSDGEGGGGPQVFRWDMEKKQVHVKTITFDGEEVRTSDIGG